MKKILFTFVFIITSTMFAQNIYFNPPTSGQTYEITQPEGSVGISYHMYCANGWYIYWYQASLRYPDGHWSNWMEGQNGGWWVTQAGTYQIQGRAYGYNWLTGWEGMLYRNPFSIYVIYNYPPPLSVTIYGPTSAQKYTTSNFTSQVTGAQGGVTYRWDKMFQCCSDEMECGEWFYRGSNSTLNEYNNSAFHYFLKLTVTDGLNNTAVDYHYVTVETCSPVGGGGSGCPTLAIESGDSETEDENPLLISSLNNPGVDIVDYYLIQSEIAPRDGEIHFTIHEPETEHTWLDQVELIEVEANEDELVAVTDAGEIVNYIEPDPFTILLNGSTDVTSTLRSADGNALNVSAGDILSVDMMDNCYGNDILVLGGIINVKDLVALMRFISDENGEIELGGFYLRPNMSIISDNFGELGHGTLEIEFLRAAAVDYLTVVKNLNTSDTETLEMTMAQGELVGDVIDLVRGDPDGNYAEIYPEQEINFAFREGEHVLSNTRYVLKTVGRYETDSADSFKKLAGTRESAIIPQENKLFDCYPNPFNPTTQIKFAVKENGYVSLKVYDVLGKEVATLVNEEKDAGTYTVNFDGSNLSSGIYFYAISANDFHQTRKMLLVK